MRVFIKLFLLVFFSSSIYATNIIKPDEIKVDQNINIVAFGEIHQRQDLQKLMFEYVDKISSEDASFNCFFTEFDASSQKSVQHFLNNKLTYEQSILPFVGERLNLLPKTLAENLKQRGFKIIPVDFVYNSEQGDRYFENVRSAKIFVEERSLLMAQNILTVLSSNECKKGFFLIGQVHTWKHAFNEEGDFVRIKPVQSHLSDLGITANTYLLHNNGLVRGVTRLHD